ncbi:HXXXD-type acyl-transferase family protein [Quillaja saponaria]|uniref:HXXXD-type acyl-transferase family protein n=1 Tax=Quillaja saponaria TaxID=32244 RepID=A0AAD7M0Q3_QUISA|nr:HXXXD-type acyl-transferase family protein [Quillaja saponaria]
MMKTPSVRCISECFIKPQYFTEESKQPHYLTPWDTAMLSAHYIQKGLLFNKPPPLDNREDFMTTLLDRLKHSLSVTLVQFYPLAGRLITQKNENPHSYYVFVDCNNSPGAKFIHASLDMAISDILSPVDVPVVVQSFFDHDRAVDHDGHTMSLLSIQVTELVDGIFIGCSINHCIADGTSYWHFFNSWSEMFQSQGQISISGRPIHKRWFPDGYGPIINLPFKHHNEFITRYEAPELRERIFHFTAESISKLKAKANAECNTIKISSFQSLSALIWRCIIRARQLPHDQTTTCKLATNNRTRLEPPLPQDYFGNSIHVVMAVTTAGELLQQSLGWAAWKLYLAVYNHNDKVLREWLQAWLQSPSVYQLGRLFDPYSVMMGSSPRFNMYGNEFGLGKAVAIRSGYANKFIGKVTSYPGYEGGGSIDLEICLPPYAMAALESDEEFMNQVSQFNPLQ